MDATVSIIVPTRNEEMYVARCLESLLSQDYPAICEILVFDGRSRDRTCQIVQEIAHRKPVVRLLDNPKGYQAGALNAGIAMAQGEIIIRADAHAFYEGDFVSQCVRHLQTTDAANVGGPMRPAIGSSFTEQCIGFCYLSRFGLAVARFHDRRAEGYADTVWLGAFWKRIFDAVGPFNEEVPRNEDILFNYRLRAAGHKIFLTPKIKSFYFPPTTFGAFMRKALSNGFAIGRSLTLMPGAFSLRHLVPLSFATALLGLSALSIPFHWALLPLALLLAIYFTTGIIFSLPGARSYGLKMLIVMPFVFFGLHFFYGVGTLGGLANGILWRRAAMRTRQDNKLAGG